MLHRLSDDIRDGLRVLTTSPGLSATAGLRIALVIGGNTTVYSIVDGAIRRPARGVTATDIVDFGPGTCPPAVRRGADRSRAGPE
jgi:hypothetical protein